MKIRFVLIICSLSLFAPVKMLGQSATLVKDIDTGSGSSTPFAFTENNGKLYFLANNATNGIEPWVTDGTEQGTMIIKDINVGAANSLESCFIKYDGKIFFGADDNTNGSELWTTDGTPQGTVLFKDIMPGSNGSIPYISPTSYAVYNGKLYFPAYDGTTLGIELYVSDGTPQGTTLLKEINAGGSSVGAFDYLFNNIGFTELNGKLYFKAYTNTYGIELWMTDGTLQGTELLKDINSGTSGSMNDDCNLFVYNGSLYFFADDGTNGYELWTSDGTSQGTVLFKDINIGAASASFSCAVDFTEINGKMLFNADNATNGVELWLSDGTPQGTTILKDIYSGSNYSSPRNFTVFNNQLFFTADNGTSGEELYVFNNCDAYFWLYRDTVNPIWYAVNQASGTSLNYTWHWGDGDSSTGAYPSHTYADAGYYNICLTVTDGNGCSDTHCDPLTYIYKTGAAITINVVAQLPTGIKESENNHFSIYPNPTNNKLNIITALQGNNDVQYQIINTLGATTMASKATAKNFSIDVSTLPTGIYFIHLQSGNEKTVKRFVKE